MDFKRHINRSNLSNILLFLSSFYIGVSTFKPDLREPAKVFSEDLESTRDKLTPSTSPFLEVKDFSLQQSNSPFDLNYKTQLITGCTVNSSKCLNIYLLYTNIHIYIQKYTKDA